MVKPVATVWTRRGFGVLWGVLSVCLAAYAPADPVVRVGLIHPTVEQVRVVAHLYQSDLLPLRNLQVVCLHHQDEPENYAAAREWAEANARGWVTFDVLSGQVDDADLFGENEWSDTFRRWFGMVDGWLFTGGEDLPPHLYGQETDLLTEPRTPQRSRYEVSLLFHLVGGPRRPEFTPLLSARPEVPVLAICLGAQSLNVAAGGTLWQDIPSQIYGLRTVEEVLRQPPDRIHSHRYIRQIHPGQTGLAPAMHPIRLVEGSFWDTVLGLPSSARPMVLSSHHQALRDVAPDLEITATSLDGQVIEAVSHRGFRQVIGVQFHPESRVLLEKGRRFRRVPGADLDLDVGGNLRTDPHSWALHTGLWRWFAQATAAAAGR